MNLAWRVSIFALCIGAFSDGALRPDVVKVGAIFTFSTINGKVARIAMKAAEDDVNCQGLGKREFGKNEEFY